MDSNIYIYPENEDDKFWFEGRMKIEFPEMVLEIKEPVLKKNIKISYVEDVYGTKKKKRNRK